MVEAVWKKALQLKRYSLDGVRLGDIEIKYHEVVATICDKQFLEAL
jgi:hypothetical protein